MNFATDMDTTLTLTKASIKMFLRAKQALFFSLFFPLVIMLIFGFIGFDKAPQFDVGLAVNGTANEPTAAFLDQIKQFTTFKIHEGDLTGELASLRNGDRAAVLDVPGDLIAEMPTAGQGQDLHVYINEGQQSQAQAIVSILSQSLDKTSLAMASIQPYFSISHEVVDSRNLKYIDFLLPGLLAMSIMQMAVFSVAFVFVQYKEKGILKRLLATPMRPMQFVTANVITRLLVSMVQAAIFVTVGVLLLKAHIIGSYLLVALCVLLGALMFLGLGFTISGLSKSVDTVPVLANLFVFPQLFLGGVFFPTSGMPNWLQAITKLLPLTYFTNAIREVMTKGAGFGDIKIDLLGMTVWVIILLFIATVTFNFQEKENV
jgi:ABC-2 type transport system permease protein